MDPLWIRLSVAAHVLLVGYPSPSRRGVRARRELLLSPDDQLALHPRLVVTRAARRQVAADLEAPLLPWSEGKGHRLPGLHGHLGDPRPGDGELPLAVDEDLAHSHQSPVPL